MDVQTVVAIVVPTLGVVVWLLRLEGAVNLNKSRTDDLSEDVKYIRQRIDEALNNHASLRKRSSD